MNAHPGPYINAESEQNVSIASQDMPANARQDTKETEDMVVNREKSRPVVAQILIVPTMPNVPKALVLADQDLKPPEPFALILTNVKDKKISVDQVRHVRTK